MTVVKYKIIRTQEEEVEEVDDDDDYTFIHSLSPTHILFLIHSYALLPPTRPCLASRTY